MKIEPSSVALVAFGPSQVGKSSFVKNLRDYYDVDEGEQPILGTGNGCSSTCEASIFSVGEDFCLMADMGGWNDTQLQITGQQMAEMTSTQLVLQDVRQVRFLVFDSLSGDTSQLRKSVDELIQGFGEGSKDSIIVVASKRDRADPDEIDARLAFMRETMEDLNIGQKLLVWQNKRLSERTMKDQVETLLLYVESTQGVETDTMRCIQKRVEDRARHLCAHQTIERRFADVEVQEPYWKERKACEQREEEYWEEVTIKTSRMSHEIEEAPVAAILGYVFTIGIYAGVSHFMSYEKKVWVKKTRAVEVWETHREEDSRIVLKHVEVEDPPKPFEHFLPQARDEVAAEIRLLVSNID